MILFLLGIVFIFLGYLFICTIKGMIFISIGTSLIAASILYFFEIWKDFLIFEFRMKIDNVLLNAGINFVHKKRDIDKYDELMDKANKQIDVLGYSLRSFFQSNREKLIELSDSRKDLKIRILVVDPNSVFSEKRERIEGETKGTYLSSIQTMYNALSQNKNIEIRKIDVPIGTMIYRIDDIIFVGPHLYKRGSTSTVTLETDNRGWLFREYEKEFENLWTDAKPFETI